MKKLEDGSEVQPEKPVVQPQQLIHEQVQPEQQVDELEASSPVDDKPPQHEVADIDIDKIEDDFFNDNLSQLVAKIYKTPSKAVNRLLGKS